MRTPECTQGQPKERKGLVKRIVGRTALALPIAFLGLCDSPPPGYSQINGKDISSSSTKQVVDESPSNPIYFTTSLGRIRWETINGVNGIPPNNPDYPTAMILVTVNGAEKPPFQPKTSLHTPLQQRLGVFVYGQAVDEETNKGFVAEAVIASGRDGGIPLTDIEVINSVNNPYDYSDEGRFLLSTEGLPQEETVGDKVSSIKVKSDINGKRLQVGIKNSGSKDGLYETKLNTLVNNVWVKVTEAWKIFIAIVNNSISNK